jgi:hypothetical protein
MQKLYTALANIVFLSHIVFGVWLLLGWQFETWRIYYLFSLALWMLPWIVLQVCPLTYFEFKLRNKAGEALDKKEEFIHHYVKKFFGITLPMPEIYWGGVAAFCIMILLAHAQ